MFAVSRSDLHMYIHPVPGFKIQPNSDKLLSLDRLLQHQNLSFLQECYHTSPTPKPLAGGGILFVVACDQMFVNLAPYRRSVPRSNSMGNPTHFVAFGIFLLAWDALTHGLRSHSDIPLRNADSNSCPPVISNFLRCRFCTTFHSFYSFFLHSLLGA